MRLKNGLVNQDQSRERRIFFVILAVGIGLRLWNITWGLPELYEEAVPLGVSWRFWNWGESGLSFNPGFFVYPAFTFYLQFVVQSIHYVIGLGLGAYSNLEMFRQAYNANVSSFVIIARSITALFDAGTIVATYQLASLYGDRRVGLAAALLIALNPLHIQQAHLINVDTPLTFFVMLSLLFIYKAYSSPSMKWYILSGISIGLASSTKYNGALLIFVLTAVHLLRSKSITEAVTSLKSKLLVTSIFTSCLVFVVCNPYIFLRFDDFKLAFSDVVEHMEKGQLGLDKGTSTIEYYFLQSLPQSMGWPLFILAAASIIYLLIGKRKTNLVLLAFPIFFIGTIGTWAMRADRYIFPVIPILIIIGSVGLVKFLEQAIEYLKQHRPRYLSELNVSTSLGAALVVASLPFMEVVKYHLSLSLPDTRTTTKQWIETHLPATSAIATGPFGIDLSNDRFALLRIPFNAGATEKTIPFYNTQLYEDLDLVITSDYDYGRYILEPKRFYEILQFYDTIRSQWTLLYEAKPGSTQSGPTFWLYKPPGSSTNIFDGELIHRLESEGDSSEVVRFIGTLGLILSVRDKFTKSEQLLEELLRIDPNNSTGHRELASVEYKLKKYDRAFVEVRKYLQVNPQDAEMIALEGNSLLQLNRLDEAEQRLKAALLLDNNIESAYLGLSIVYGSREEKEKMINNLSRYLNTLQPNSRKSKMVEGLLSKLKKPS